MYSLKDEFEEMFFGNTNPKTIAKKKLNEYYDRYGENRWNIENQIPDDEYWDYFFVDLQKCLDCHCIAEYFDKNGTKLSGKLPLNCNRETKDKIRCFTYNGYEEVEFGNSEDFENCNGFSLNRQVKN